MFRVLFTINEVLYQVLAGSDSEEGCSCPVKQKLKLVVTASLRAIVHNQHIVEQMLHLSVAGVKHSGNGDVVEVVVGLITPQIWVNVAGMKTTAVVVADAGDTGEKMVLMVVIRIFIRKFTFSNMAATW